MSKQDKEIIPFMKFSPEIKKALHTTNAIESMIYTIRKSRSYAEGLAKFDNSGSRFVELLGNYPVIVGCQAN